MSPGTAIHQYTRVLGGPGAAAGRAYASGDKSSGNDWAPPPNRNTKIPGTPVIRTTAISTTMCSARIFSRGASAYFKCSLLPQPRRRSTRQPIPERVNGCCDITFRSLFRVLVESNKFVNTTEKYPLYIERLKKVSRPADTHNTLNPPPTL